MFRVIVDVDLDKFILRHVRDPSDIERRDELLANKYPTPFELYYGGEPFGRLTLASNGQEMDAFGGVPMFLAMELIRARDHLEQGDSAFTAANDGSNYGVCLQFERSADRVVVGRTFESVPLLGPPQLEMGWLEFVEGVEQYLEWFHTDYVSNATWILRMEYAQRMRLAAGYPADHL